MATRTVRKLAPHGSRARYMQKCKCRACRADHARYMAEWRLRTGRTKYSDRLGRSR